MRPRARTATVQAPEDLLGTAMREFADGGRLPLHLRVADGRRLHHDRSAGALAVARALGLRHALHTDALAGPLPRGLGTALLLDGNLGLAGSLRGARRILGRLASACVPGGRLLVGGHAPAGTTVRRLVLRIEYRGAVGPWFAWLQLSLGAMAAVAASAGWRLETADEARLRYLACLRRDRWSP